MVGDTGIYWRGRRPKSGDFKEIEKLIVEADQISPCLNTQRGGIIGKDFEWSAVIPGGTTNENGEEVDLAADHEGAMPELREASAAMSSWHRESGLHNAAKQIENARQWGGLSTFRVYIPDVWQDVAYQGSCDTLEEALELIHVQALDKLQAGPVEDEHGREVGYFYRWSDREDGLLVNHVELHTPRYIYRLQATGTDAWSHHKAD